MKFSKFIFVLVALLGLERNVYSMNINNSELFEHHLLNLIIGLNDADWKTINYFVEQKIQEIKNIDKFRKELEEKNKGLYNCNIKDKLNEKISGTKQSAFVKIFSILEILDEIIKRIGNQQCSYSNLTDLVNYQLVKQYGAESAKFYKELSISSIWNEGKSRCIGYSLWLSDILNKLEIENYIIIDMNSENSWHVYNIVINNRNNRREIFDYDITRDIQNKSSQISNYHYYDLRNNEKRLYILDPNDFDKDTPIKNLKIVSCNPDILDKIKNGEKIKDISNLTFLTLEDLNFENAMYHCYPKT